MRTFRIYSLGNFQVCTTGTSLVAQWLRIHLPIQGTWVWSLVQEDPTCCGATKPVCHNYWACALEPTSHNYWARMPQLLKPACLEPMLRNKRSHRKEKTVHCNEEQPSFAATRESPRTATKTQRSQKKKKKSMYHNITVLYITSPWLTYFIMGSLHLKRTTFNHMTLPIRVYQTNLLKNKSLQSIISTGICFCLLICF